MLTAHETRTTNGGDTMLRFYLEVARTAFRRQLIYRWANLAGFPMNWQNWLPFLFSLLLGASIGIAYRVLYNVIAFWFLEARAMGTLFVVVALFFTGSYIPIPFFPSWLLTITSWLPFNGLINI